MLLGEIVIVLTEVWALNELKLRSVTYFLFTEVNICVIRSLNILTEFDIHDKISRFMMASWLSTEPNIQRIIL